MGKIVLVVIVFGSLRNVSCVVASAQGFSSHDMQCIMLWLCTPCLLQLLMGKNVRGEMVEGDLLGSHAQTIIFQCPYFPG